MTRRRRPRPAELLDDELTGLRRDVDALRNDVSFLLNLWALAPFTRSRPRPTVLVPAQRRPSFR